MYARALAGLLVLASLAACERDKPMTQTGAALDRAGTQTGNAVGRAASDTGAAMDRAGNWVDRKLSSDPQKPPAPAP